MSIEYMSYVWSNKERFPDQAVTLLMLSIADHANDKGTCWPGINLLAEKARMSRRSVSRHLATLVEKGELFLHVGKGPMGCNLYQIVKDGQAAPLSDPMPNCHTPPCQIGVAHDKRAGGAMTELCHTPHDTAMAYKPSRNPHKNQEGCAVAQRGTEESDAQWFEGLQAEECYKSLDLTEEWGKMNAWCAVNRKKASRRRFINWINHADKQIELKGAAEPMGLPKQIFPKAGEAMIRTALEAIKAIRAKPESWVSGLARGAARNVEWLQANHPVQWEERVKEIKAEPKNYVRLRLKDAAQAEVNRLNERVAEIKRRMTE